MVYIVTVSTFQTMWHQLQNNELERMWMTLGMA